MEVSLAESLQNYENELQNQEKHLIQTSKAQYEDEQLLEMTIKESMVQNNEEQFPDDMSESEMLRKAIEMSKPANVMQQSEASSYEDIIQLALEYGFDSEQAVQAISVIGTNNPEMVINYLMSMFEQGYNSGF